MVLTAFQDTFEFHSLNKEEMHLVVVFLSFCIHVLVILLHQGPQNSQQSGLFEIQPQSIPSQKNNKQFLYTFDFLSLS